MKQLCYEVVTNFTPSKLAHAEITPCALQYQALQALQQQQMQKQMLSQQILLQQQACPAPPCRPSRVSSPILCHDICLRPLSSYTMLLVPTVIILSSNSVCVVWMARCARVLGIDQPCNMLHLRRQ